MIRDLGPLPYHVGRFGPGLILCNQIEQHLETIREHDVREFTLSSIAPMQLDPLDPLKAIDGVRGVRIALPNREIEAADWEVLSDLPELRYLILWQQHKSGGPRLGNHPELEWLRIWERRGLDLAGAPQLRGLTFVNWSGRGVFHELPGLEHLALLQPRMEDLRPLAALKNLKSLSVFGARALSTLEGVEQLPALEELELHACRGPMDCSALARAPALRRVSIEDCKQILRLQMRDLEAIRFIGSSRLIEGDWNWLAACPGLQYWALSDTEAAKAHGLPPFPNAPAPATPGPDHVEPAVRPYENVQQFAFGQKERYPAWFRDTHPDLCT